VRLGIPRIRSGSRSALCGLLIVLAGDDQRNPMVTSQRLSQTRCRAWGATGKATESVDSTAVRHSALCG
jgi:hypothetical protein